MSLVAGVDGCRGGWLVATLDGRGSLGIDVAPRFEDVLAIGAETVAVDMPIGLLDESVPGGRACDRAARAVLGPRGRSVFSPPLRGHLGAGRFEDVRGLSLQAFRLVPRIAELDALMTPRLQRGVVEAHPELAFAQMCDGTPMAHAKRTVDGVAARRRALRNHGIEPAGAPPAGARRDDVLDACVLAWTARRVLEGRSLVLPGPRPPRDSRGLRMEIRA